MPRLHRHRERHVTDRIGWLRAAVLGANDGIVSTASLMVGVAAAEPQAEAVLVAGVAGLVAGAMSMAAGEYVSVSSQGDAEAADLAREQRELDTEPEHELDELSAIYVGRGLDPALAREVAVQLMDHDALAAHARDVADLSLEVGGRLGMATDELRTLSYGALLHDIGKIGVRSEILHKPSDLTAAEYEEMKEHTVVGARMLERIPYFSEVHPLVRCSHERWDGAGYPDGLAGEEIPLGARVIAACDAFHAMTSDRPYRDALSPHEAQRELQRCSGTQFDPAVIEALVAVLDLPSGEVVDLRTAMGF